MAREGGRSPGPRRAGRWGRCPGPSPRLGGGSSLPLVDGSLPGPRARGPRRVALAAAPFPDAHPVRCRCQAGAGRAWRGAPAARPRGRRRPVHPRLRRVPRAPGNRSGGGRGTAGGGVTDLHGHGAGRRMPEPRAAALPSAPFSRLLGPGFWLPRWAEEVGARCWHISHDP